jgi:LysR family glycine cleavage system transcriptional activator
MEWRDLPPLSALRAFAAFAQTGNVVAAGEALGVSHAAISQQLRSLEEHLGVALLDRSGRALEMTADGQVLAQAVERGFAQMIEAVQTVTGARDARPLHISTTPMFAVSWLMPRLPRFRALNPDVDLMLDPTPEVVALSTDGIDVAIRYGSGPWPGLDAQMLVRSPMVVVGAPSLVGTGALPSIDDLADLPWLEELGITESTKWLAKHGVHKAQSRGQTRVPGNLLLDGARDGQGIAVTVRAFVERDIASGRLRLLHSEADDCAGYHVVSKPGAMRPLVKAFVKWIKREAAQDS